MKLFKISYPINPLAEVSRDTKMALARDPKCRRLISVWKYEDVIELNERKWNDQELTDAITAFIRYDLKVLDVALSDALKKAGKKNVPPSDIVEGVIDNFRAQIEKKLSRGLDELTGDGGENKAAAKSLTTALQKIPAGVSADLFKKAIDDVDEVIDRLNSSAGKDEVPDKSEVLRAVSGYDKAIGAFSKSGSASKQAIDALISSVTQIKAKKDLDKKILDIVAALKKEIGTFENYKEKIEEFDKIAAKVKAEIQSKSVKSGTVLKAYGELTDYTKFDRTADAIRKTCANARRDLKQAKTELKLK